MTSASTDLEAMFAAVSNWMRWGADDEFGTLNLITPERVAAAACEVRSGITVACGRLDFTPTAATLSPPVHSMLNGGDGVTADFAASRDLVTIAPHSAGCAHIDAFCHVFWKGEMYNGRPASLVGSSGAVANSILPIASGITTRGVLLDVPKFRGAPYVDVDAPVHRYELIAAQQSAGVQIEPGDALLIRMGRYERRRQLGTVAETTDRPPLLRLAGLDVDCLEWFHELDISLLVSDGGHDFLPSPFTTARVPIHIGALVFMGLHLIDNADLEPLATACSAAGRASFLFSVAPLHIPGGTGSPVNPLALL